MTSPQSAPAPTKQDEKLLQGRYRVTRCLGSGGMGDVYLAEDLRLHRLVAVKSLKQEFSKMPEVRKRIERECVMHAQLGAHPNIITLYDRVDESGTIHLIIEFVDGITLKELIEKARLGSIYLTWRESVSIACQLLEALAKIHAQDIAHRDVKPANIMLTQGDTGAYTAKLMDFGIARLMNPVDGATMLTREGGSGPGTPIYMSPEQIAGAQFGPLSPATDVYAMGVVLFQMLAKRPPFQGTITDIFHGHLNASPPPIDTAMDSTYPPQLTEVVYKALAKQPANRYASAAEFRYALKRLTKAHGVVTTLAVSDTIAASGPRSPAGVTVPMPPAAIEHTTSGLLGRRNEGARSASRTVIAIAVVLAAVTAVVLGNFYFFRSLTTQDTPQNTMPAPESQQLGATPAANADHTDQPAPVTMEDGPKPTAEKPVDTTRESATKQEQVTKDKGAESSSVKPSVESPTPIVTPIPSAPKEKPPRSPVPLQTPVSPDVSSPTHESKSFSEGARRPAQEMTPIPRQQTQGSPQSNTNIFDDVQVTKKPAIKVN